MTLLTAGDQPWKDKQIAEWSEDDAKQVLADSPWAKTVTPTVDRNENGGGRRSGGGMGRGGGIGIGGIGLGIPGIGMGRRGGMGGGGYPGGGQRRGPGEAGAYSNPPDLHLRWESALPVRSAELKARETNAPTLDESHYAIAIYGVPRRLASADAKDLANQLKKEAELKRDGKKDIKPSSVEVLQRDDGPVIVYLFPRSQEISRQDKRIEFDARIGRLDVTQSFYPGDMTYLGKLEL